MNLLNLNYKNVYKLNTKPKLKNTPHIYYVHDSSCEDYLYGSLILKKKKQTVNDCLKFFENEFCSKKVV